jgi:hypothetical protein
MKGGFWTWSDVSRGAQPSFLHHPDKTHTYTLNNETARVYTQCVRAAARLSKSTRVAREEAAFNFDYGCARVAPISKLASGAAFRRSPRHQFRTSQINALEIKPPRYFLSRRQIVCSSKKGRCIWINVLFPLRGNCCELQSFGRRAAFKFLFCSLTFFLVLFLTSILLFQHLHYIVWI